MLIVHQPTKEHIRILIKNLLPIYRENIYYLPISSFEDLFHVEVEPEDMMNHKTPEGNSLIGQPMQKGASTMDKELPLWTSFTNIVFNIQVVRRFSDLGEPIVTIFVD